MEWPIVKLGDITEVITKGTTPTSVGFKFIPEGVNFVKVESITSEGRFLPHKFAAISEECNESLKRSQLKEGDVLFSIAGALGRTALVTRDILPANTNQALAIIRLKAELVIDKHFLLLALTTSVTLEQVENSKGGVAQQNLSLGQLKGFEIPLPTISEQKRIVAILEKTFADIEQARTKTEENLKNARELFESYMQQVFSERGEGWRASKLKEITSKIGSGATPRGGRASYKSEGISLIRSMNVHDRRFKNKDLAFIDDQQADKLNNVVVENNDVLLNITGASVARCCLAPEEYLPARVNQHVSIIRADRTVISPAFLNFVLTSKYYKDQLLGIGEAGSTRQAITKTQIEEFEVSYPENLEDQQNLLSSLYSLEEKTNDIQRIYRKKLLDLDELKKSILQKAFSGELTKTLEVDTYKGAVA